MSHGGTALMTPQQTTGSAPKSAGELAAIVTAFAASDAWLERVRFRADQRWYERLYQDAEYDVWVISWLPGQSTGFHDHGGSAGAFVVATGALEEHRVGEPPRQIHSGEPRAFGSEYTHDVLNASPAPAISLHAYSPPLNEMNEYELEGTELVPRESTSTERFAPGWRVLEQDGLATAGTSMIDRVLGEARSRLRRLSPDEAYEAVTKAGAVLIDIRPAAQRAREGSIEGALLVERNVLEWRLDPSSSARLPVAADRDLQAIVFCSEGYSSSLAAAALQQLGLWRATDVVGGFLAWQAAALPLRVPSRRG